MSAKKVIKKRNVSKKKISPAGKRTTVKKKASAAVKKGAKTAVKRTPARTKKATTTAKKPSQPSWTNLSVETLGKINLSGDIKDIKNQLKIIIAEVLEINPNKVTLNTDFVKDMGMDSMMALEILAVIEKAYGIEIPEEALPRITSFDEVITLTKELIDEKRNSKSKKRDKKPANRKRVQK